jgi:hypothetical protein
MRNTRAFSLVCSVFVAAGVGCSPNGGSDLSKARADAEAARAEVTSLRSELESLRSESARAKADDARARDLKQARLVAEGFLAAITRPNVDQLHGFCTPGQQKRINTVTLPPGKVSWSIDTEAIGADGRETAFKGQFVSSAGKQPFVVLVIKFANAGRDRWLVDAFSVSGV